MPQFGRPLTGAREEEIIKIARFLYRVCKNEGRIVDLNSLISTYSFNNIIRVLAGKSCIGEGDIESEVEKKTIKGMKETFAHVVSLGACDYFQILRWIGYKGMEKNLICMHNKRDEFLQSLIDEAREKSYAKLNLIGTLLSLHQVSDPEFYTDYIIKSILQTMISAGTDTTALTIEWAMSLLLVHTEKLEKLKKEIDENVGHDHLLNESDLVKLPYLGWVVNETLRLHPAMLLLLSHYSSEDCVVSGYNIPKGTILLVIMWAMHRDPNLWDEPDKFNPERFQGMDKKREDHKFVPFGVGRMSCPGAAMAIKTVCLTLGVFVQCFEWQKTLEDVEMDFEANLRVTLHKANPLEAVCIPRNETTHLLSPF